MLLPLPPSLSPSLPPSLSFAQRPRKSKLFLLFFSSISPSFTFKHFCPDSFPEIRGMGTLTVLHSKGGKGQMPKGLGPTDRWRVAGAERFQRRSENRDEANLCFCADASRDNRQRRAARPPAREDEIVSRCFYPSSPLAV